MKLQITKDNVPMHGYTYISNDFLNIKNYAYPSQVVEIYAPDALKYIHLTNHSEFISMCRTLLKVGGKLIIGGLDLMALNSLITNLTLTLNDVNHVLFETELKSITTLGTVRNILHNNSFHIDQLYIDDSTDGEFVFTATAKESNE
ncbi:MAG TPA: hypothetical protein V6C58_28315 [Allocoleopsis sp.]